MRTNNKYKAIREINRILNEGFDPLDPTGYFKRRDEHNKIENRVNNCIRYIRSRQFMMAKSKLENFGIIVRTNINGRNCIRVVFEFDESHNVDRDNYSFVINFYNMPRVDGDPFRPTYIPFLNMVKREVPEAYREIYDILLKLSGN